MRITSVVTFPLSVAFLMVSCHWPGPEGDAVVLQNGAVRLVEQGNLAGQTPCSEGRGGLDRWCVFFKQKQSNTRGQDVWALNVSRVGRGESAGCDKPGPGCVPIVSGDHLVHWGFVADTLILDGAPATVMATASLNAPVTAWRPGWASAVAVTANPVSACWADVATESVACVELGSAGVDASVDASTSPPGTFYAGRLTLSRPTLTVVPEGRTLVQALAASDSLLVDGSSGVARVHLDSGTTEMLSAQVGSIVGVTPDEQWFLSSAVQKSDVTGTRSLLAAPFPQGGVRHVLLGNVLRHALMQGPRATGADVLAVSIASDGANHLFLVGPNSTGAPVSTDLGPWAGTSTDKLDASSGDGYAVVADTQATAVLSLLAPSLPCVLGTSVVPLSQVATVPAVGDVIWVDAAAGAAGTGFGGSLAGCTKAEVFASSAASLQVERSHDLLFIDSAKHLYHLDLSLPGAQPISMRDPDEVVYRWSYADSDDVLILEMTSSFDTAIRLYALRQPF
jgi:hypothetical protein